MRQWLHIGYAQPTLMISWSNGSSERRSLFRTEVRVPSFEEFAMVFLDEFLHATTFSRFEAIREFFTRFRSEPPFRFATSLGDVYMRWFVVLVAEEVKAEAIFQ